MRSTAALAFALLLVVAVGPIASLGSAGLAVANGDAVEYHQASPPSKPPETTITIHLRANGNAWWNVTTRFSLGNENRTAAFKELATDFERGDVDVGLDVGLFERFAREASSQTGRAMEITNISRTARMRNETGTLSLRFTWTNFTRTSGTRVIMGDVFLTEEGTWLSSLSASQRLVVHAPEHYLVVSAPIGVTNGTLVWDGPQTFEPGELAATYKLSRQPTTPDPSDAFDLRSLAVIVALISLGGGMSMYILARRRRTDSISETEVVDEGERVGGTEHGEPPAVDDEQPETGGSSEPDEALLSDEERVERLLTANGGRMKQAAIVKETGWSNAKVSQLLSAMDEDGQIDKLRIGRENLISLPDEENLGTSDRWRDE